jgi:FAD/FMN-containing dehydrogenase
MAGLPVVTRNGGEATLSDGIVRQFGANLRGELIQKGDGGYDAARRVWNAMIDRRPALIARCRGAADVVAAVDFARAHDLLVAVRGGGHSVAGHSTCDGGLVIDLSAMRSVRVDRAAGTVRVEGGATWGDVDRETQLFGLATPGGVVSTTGVAGLTLGGGYGWLRRKYGLSCDNLVSADVITADGRLLTASENEHPDLLWGLKGGGGNFGIVTSFELRLHPVGPDMMYAATMYPVESAAEVLRAWREWTATAPDEVTSDASLWSVLPIPDMPPDLHGRPMVLVEGVYAGDVAEGERVMQPLREWAEPLLDLSQVLPYTVLNGSLDDVLPPGGLQCYWKSLYLNDLGPETIDTLVDWSLSRPSALTVLSIGRLGGAMSRVGAGDTALGDRSAPFLLSIDSNWLESAEADANIAWTRVVWDDMRRYSTGATYFNFAGLLEEGQALVRTTFGANHGRLVELKNEYDPTNLFRLNQNIVPERQRAEDLAAGHGSER